MKEFEGHTPGPWIWGENFNGLYGAGPNNAVLSYADYEGMWLAYEGDRKANAALIAAAPQLLADRKELVEALQSIAAVVSNDSLEEVRTIAKGALSRLESKEQSNG